MTIDPDAENATIEEMASSFAAGAISGGLWEGIGGIAGKFNTPKISASDTVITNLAQGKDLTAEEIAVFAPTADNADARDNFLRRTGMVLPKTKQETESFLKKLSVVTREYQRANRQDLLKIRTFKKVEDEQPLTTEKVKAAEQECFCYRRKRAAENRSEKNFSL